MQKSLIGLMFTALIASSALANEGQNESISVSSTEMQYGEQVASSEKHGVPAEPTSVQRNAAKPQTFAKADKPAHSSKQLAAPLSKPFNRDARMTVADPDFWIFDAFVTFNIDNDFDGFYSTFTIEFDADTIYTEAPVYARIYISRGEVFTEISTTSVFFIYGDASTDTYGVRSELQTGFPTGDYEALIELYDGDTDELVAVFDGFNDVDLTMLTLESKTFEEVDSVVIVESGGSFGYLMFLLVPLLWRKTSLKISK